MSNTWKPGRPGVRHQPTRTTQRGQITRIVKISNGKKDWRRK